MLLQLDKVEYSVLASIELMVSYYYAYSDQPCFTARQRIEKTSPRALERLIFFFFETSTTGKCDPISMESGLVN